VQQIANQQQQQQMGLQHQIRRMLVLASAQQSLCFITRRIQCRLYNHVYKSGAIRGRLQTAMQGLSQEKVDRLSTEFYTYMQLNWQAMANLHGCCNRIHRHPHEYDNCKKLAKACDSILWLSRESPHDQVKAGPCLALARAHVGPSQVDCSAGASYLVDSFKGFDAEVQRQTIMGRGMHALKGSHEILYGAGSWNVLVLAKIFRDAAEPLQSVHTTGQGELQD
jgi:hypothetical protein